MYKEKIKASLIKISDKKEKKKKKYISCRTCIANLDNIIHKYLIHVI